MKTLNINSNVTFILTDISADLLNEYYSDFGGAFRPKHYKAGDEYTGQLWHCFSLFGASTGLGKQTFCFNAEIKIFDKDLT